MRDNQPVRIIPLGGLDGIGKNMTVIEYENDMILIDAGLMFPDDQHPGVDLILPDYTYVLENEHKLRGIVITHGHEDHTGALPYLLKDLNNKPNIYSSKLTLGLIEGKLAEHKIRDPKLREVTPGTHTSFGKISVDFFSVNHSIPSAMGIFIRTPQGNIIHTGDFKFDQTPVDGVKTDFASILRFNKAGVDLLLSDSTNATRSGYTPSEREVGANLTDIILRSKQRVFVATFASQIHRMQQICDAAKAAGRKVAVTGRSMLTNTKIARELGYLDIDEDDLIDSYDLKGFRDDEIVVMCTGSQGEPLSALARMSAGEHRTLSINEGDTVIISATPVPGNEKAVSQIVNNLAKIGAVVYDKSKALVHVSGHGSAEELKLMLAMTEPTYFAPIHGEATHLRAHARLAENVGVDPRNIFIIENGDSLELRDGKVKLGPTIGAGIVYVDGLRIGDTDQVVLRDRQQLADGGIITVVITISSRSKELVGTDLVVAGVTLGDEREFKKEAKNRVARTLKKNSKNHSGDVNAIQKAVRESLSGYLWNSFHARPMIIPIVMEV